MTSSHEVSDATGRAQQVVVVDLDGTLVSGDSFGAFLRRLITRHPVRRVAAAATAPAWLRDVRQAPSWAGCVSTSTPATG